VGLTSTSRLGTFTDVVTPSRSARESLPVAGSRVVTVSVHRDTLTLTGLARECALGAEG
jgi:hypothetical protein